MQLDALHAALRSSVIVQVDLIAELGVQFLQHTSSRLDIARCTSQPEAGLTKQHIACSGNAHRAENIALSLRRDMTNVKLSKHWSDTPEQGTIP